MSVLGATGRGLSDGRRARQAGGYRLFQPEDDGWGDAYVLFANRHMRHDPIWSKMLHGQTDEQIEAWLRSKAGRAVRREVGPRGADPHKWVSEMREVFDHMFPTPAVRAAARDRDLTPGELDDLIPFELRDTVHGDEILMANGSRPMCLFGTRSRRTCTRTVCVPISRRWTRIR